MVASINNAFMIPSPHLSCFVCILHHCWSCRANPGGGCDLVSTMPICVCPKLKEMGYFWLQVNEMNEKMSFKMGVKCIILYGQEFSRSIACIYIPEVNYNQYEDKLNQ